MSHDLQAFIPPILNLITIIIPYYLERSKITERRAQKIFDILKPELQKIIYEQLESFKTENPNDEKMVKFFNCRKILNEAFLDLDAETTVKKRLLNYEVDKIINNEYSYKYIYNKITVKDLELLKILGDSEAFFTKKSELIKLIKHRELIEEIPTYAALKPDKIYFRNSLDKTWESNDSRTTITYSHSFNAYIYKWDAEKYETHDNITTVVKRYVKYENNLINLINLKIIIPKNDFPIPTSDIEIFKTFYPFAFKITEKGKEIYQLLILNK